MGSFTRFAIKLENTIADKFDPPEVFWKVDSIFFDLIDISVRSSRAGTGETVVYYLLTCRDIFIIQCRQFVFHTFTGHNLILYCSK